MSEQANIAALIREHAALRPEVIALGVADGRGGFDRWTYRQLVDQADRYSRGLRAAGVRKGDRTLFLVKPSLDFYALLIGLLQVGAVPVVVDPGMGLKNMLACIAQIRPRVVVAIPAVHVVRTFVRKPFAAAEIFVTAGRRLFWGGTTTAALSVDGDPVVVEAFDAADEALIVFTSGSTGVPKGVSFRHGMFRAATRTFERHLDLGAPKTSIETFAPFVPFHLALGETVVIPDMNLTKPATADPARIVDAITTWKPDAMFASPVVLRKVMQYCLERQLRLPNLKSVLTGVAPIPGALHEGFAKILEPGGRLVVNYGATEALTLAKIESPEVLGETWALTRAGHRTCVGRPFAEVDLRVMRITDGPVAVWSDDLGVAPGELGEIVARGDVVSPEYKDLPEANAKAKIVDGDVILHRMGDLGYKDDKGRIWFCGRKAHRLETVKGTIPNVPVEGLFDAHPKVRRTALVGVGPKGQQVPVLCVEMEPGEMLNADTERALLALADGTKWAGVVERVLLHPGFPMDARHNSKIRNEDLGAWATGRVERR